MQPASFDDGLDRLETLVQKLESGQLGLEEALREFEDGVNLSNTYLLERDFDWRGILAEPNPVWHADLKRNRRANIDLRCVFHTTSQFWPFQATSVFW